MGAVVVSLSRALMGGRTRGRPHPSSGLGEEDEAVGAVVVSLSCALKGGRTRGRPQSDGSSLRNGLGEGRRVDISGLVGGVLDLR